MLAVLLALVLAVGGLSGVAPAAAGNNPTGGMSCPFDDWRDCA
jgi:hypothetical protein